MDTIERHWYRQSASRITIIAHLFGLLALILLLVWLLHFREGLNLDSDDPLRIFNVHPFLMLFGFIFFAGEAMMAYKTVPAERKVQKFVHMLLHIIAITLGIVGIHATFKFHDRANVPNLTSLHSWIGIITFCFFISQWIFGMVLFMFPGTMSDIRLRALPLHVTGGRALLYMAICAAETGLMQKATFLQLETGTESRLIIFLAFAILFFGITVDITVSLARFV